MKNYSYTQTQANADYQAADMQHRASRDELAAAGWYVPRDGSMPSRNGNAAGPGAPEGFTCLAVGVANCCMVVRARDQGVAGVYRTPAQAAAYRAACIAIRERYNSGREGRRAAGLDAVRRRARELGCHRRAA